MNILILNLEIYFLDVFNCPELMKSSKTQSNLFIFAFLTLQEISKNASTDNLVFFKSFKIIWLELKANGVVD